MLVFSCVGGFVWVLFLGLAFVPVVSFYRVAFGVVTGAKKVGGEKSGIGKVGGGKVGPGVFDIQRNRR